MPERYRRDAASLVSQIVEALRERAKPRYFTTEEYGPDGEIVTVHEYCPLTPGEQADHTLTITCHGFAAPRTDWRERGVVPPGGYHRSRWRD